MSNSAFRSRATSGFFRFSVRRGAPKRGFRVFLPFPRVGKRCFCCFLLFGVPRNAVFAIFCSSGFPETLFSLFFALRGAPKRCFCCFLLFGVPRNAVFAVFCSSGFPETQFLLFLALRPWPKRSFHRFLSFGRGRNAVFTVFCPSAVAERHPDPAAYARSEYAESWYSRMENTNFLSRCSSWLEIRQFDDFIYGGMQAVDVFTACLCVMGLSAAAALNELGCFSDDLACV